MFYLMGELLVLLVILLLGYKVLAFWVVVTLMLFRLVGVITVLINHMAIVPNKATAIVGIYLPICTALSLAMMVVLWPEAHWAIKYGYPLEFMVLAFSIGMVLNMHKEAAK